MLDNHQKNIATLIHLSTFSRFFFPLGNIIAPLLLWVLNKEKSEFIDDHGKQALNFQISVLLYAIILGTISIPLFVFNLFSDWDIISFHGFESFHINISKPSPLLYISGGVGIIAFIGFIIELILIIRASLIAKEGKLYHYPFSINFIK